MSFHVLPVTELVNLISSSFPRVKHLQPELIFPTHTFSILHKLITHLD